MPCPQPPSNPLCAPYLPDTRRLQTHSACRHTVLAGTRRLQTHSACRHTVLADTRRLQTHSACRHTVLADTRCLQTHSACRHTALADTQCLQTHSACRHTVLADTRCLQTHGACRHTALADTRRLQTPDASGGADTLRPSKHRPPGPRWSPFRVPKPLCLKCKPAQATEAEVTGIPDTDREVRHTSGLMSQTALPPAWTMLTCAGLQGGGDRHPGHELEGGRHGRPGPAAVAAPAAACRGGCGHRGPSQRGCVCLCARAHVERSALWQIHLSWATPV